ncbi:MAG: sugar dehydrogenase, partial [Streptomycetaceae bacterium]|nr:sugar dehydrogenase [Streptomycetaceae bacterium]
LTAADGVARFSRWNDSAPRAREFVMPDQGLTLSAAYLSPMEQRYATDAVFRAQLGAPTGPEVGDKALRYRDYTGGRAYWTPESGVHEVHGAIRANYLAGGGHAGFGEPVTDEAATPDGVGRYNHFLRGASSYWTPGTGAHLVYGAIREKWASMGWERGPHGYPLNDEATTGNGLGRYNNFQNGAIYWSGLTGAHGMYGEIWATYGSLGWDRGFLGFPLTDELGTPDGVGRYNHMQGGSLYWTPATGGCEVHGAIRDRWAERGWERSYLGYPVSHEYPVPGGRRSDFQHGYIFWNATTGAVTDTRY